VLTNILRRQCEQRLRGLDIPHPFCLDTFAATVEAHRGRPLRVLPLPGLDGSDALSGAWVATDAADYVLIDADASPWHRNLIGLHEIGHILCDHGGAPGLRELAADLLPTLSDATVRRFLGRHGYSREDEQEAELMACLILEQADADLLPVSSAGPAGIAGRLAHALRHPVRHA
jgi:hypothetical protein